MENKRERPRDTDAFRVSCPPPPGAGWFYVDHAGLEHTSIHLPLPPSTEIKGVRYHAWLTSFYVLEN